MTRVNLYKSLAVVVAMKQEKKHFYKNDNLFLGCDKLLYYDTYLNKSLIKDTLHERRPRRYTSPLKTVCPLVRARNFLFQKQNSQGTTSQMKFA